MDASEAREVVTAWKVFRTVHEMLEDRVSPNDVLLEVYIGTNSLIYHLLDDER